MARSEELNAKLIREMNERNARDQERRRDAQQRQQVQQLDDPSQEQTGQQLERDQQAERQREQQSADQQRTQQQRDDSQNLQAAAEVGDDLSYDDPSYDDPTLGSAVEDELEFPDDYDYDEFGGGGGAAPVVGGGEQTWAAPTAESRLEGRPGPSEPAGRQQDPDAAPDRRPGEGPGRAPGAGPDGRPGQDTPGQDGPTRQPGTQSGDRVVQQHTGRDTGGRRPGAGPQRPGGPNSGPGRGAGAGADRGAGAGAGAGGGAGAGAQNRPGPAGPPAQQQRPGQGRKRLGGVLKAAGGAMDPSNIVEGGAVGRGSQSFGVMDAAADVAKVLNATKSVRTIPRPQVGTPATPHAGSTAGGHHRAHGHGGPSQNRGQSEGVERTRAGR